MRESQSQSSHPSGVHFSVYCASPPTSICKTTSPSRQPTTPNLCSRNRWVVWLVGRTAKNNCSGAPQLSSSSPTHHQPYTISTPHPDTGMVCGQGYKTKHRLTKHTAPPSLTAPSARANGQTHKQLTFIM